MRNFQRADALTAVKAGFRSADGERHLAEGALQIPLAGTTAIPTLNPTPAEDKTEQGQGESVIANSDCLDCHAPDRKVTGPAWAQIAGKFRGEAQEEVVAALAHSIVEGSVGTWGPVPMPPNPAVADADLKAMIAYVLALK
mgnify:CR=1 FL=1